MKIGLLVAVALALAGCPPKPVNPPVDADADVMVSVSDADSSEGGNPFLDGAPAVGLCDGACTTLRGLGCPEGREDMGQGCTTVCKHTLNGQFDLKPQCILDHPTRAGVIACGTVKCTSAAAKK